LTDGGFAVQLSSAIHAAHAVRVAKRIGCVKYVNAGTLGETYLERYLAGKNTKKYQSSQLDYSLAKLAGRDMCKMVAYLEKIDYVHTRMSIPLCPNLSRGSYVAQTLKKIIKGEEYSPPKDNYLFDIISTDDVAQAYYLLGNYGKNKADYFIGTSRPASLVDYFERCADQNNHTREGIFFSPLKDEIDLFSTESLFRDTNFVCTTDFEKIIVRLKSP
jgi:nucleoside-diphosphate-sugar epimerase